MSSRWAISLIVLTLGYLKASNAQNLSTTAAYALGSSSILLNGYTFINYNSYGKGYTVATTSWDYGLYSRLNYQAVWYSDFFTGASCGLVEFTSNYSTVTAFLVTKEVLIQWRASGRLDYTNYKRQSNFYWEDKTYGKYTFSLNSTQKYGFVVVNSGGQLVTGGSNREAGADLGVFLDVYDSRASICSSAKQPSGYPTSDATARSNPNLLPYVEASDTMLSQLSLPYATLDSMSCLSIQLPAQPSAASPMDLTLAVIPLSRYVDWNNGGRVTSVPWIGYAITQNSNTTATTPSLVTQTGSPSTTASSRIIISKSQTGQVNIDNLNPDLKYLLVIYNGLYSLTRNTVPVDFLFRYMVKTSGSCANNVFQDGSNQFIKWSTPTTTPAPPGSPPAALQNTQVGEPITPPGPPVPTAGIPPGPAVIPSPPRPAQSPAAGPPPAPGQNPPPKVAPPPPNSPVTPLPMTPPPPIAVVSPPSPIPTRTVQAPIANGTGAQALAPGPAAGTGLAVVGALAGKSCSADAPAQQQILQIRGQAASISAYPYLVSIRAAQAAGGRPDKKVHFCGGSLLFDRIVITAAHCCASAADPAIPWTPNFTTPTGVSIKDPPSAVIGTDCSNSDGLEEQPISYVVVHPLWNRDYKNGYDICLMVTAKPFSKAAMQGRTLKLANSTAYQKAQSIVQAAGWGLSGLSGPSPVLKDLNMSIVSNPEFTTATLAAESTQLWPNQLMATSAEGSTCSGDSGGPLIFSPSGHQNPSTDILLGLVSYGKKDCRANTWSIFTDVTSFAAQTDKSCSDLENYKLGTGDRYDAFIPCTIKTLYPDYNFADLISTQPNFFVAGNS